MTRKTFAIDDELLQALNLFAKKDQRDFSSALRYALKIGLAAIENPELNIEEIKDALEAKVDVRAGRILALEFDKI
ncbi:MAG: hypothetical protein JXI33_01900 [Candidatus Aminicenantes bacterium]|nr:hypothetical protein [Candidatus Aminicenantes bacterium]